MLDLFGIPGKGLDKKVFTGLTSPGANNAANYWHPWRKPKNAKFVFIYLLGAGAGGGKGLSNSAGTARGGGGGGGGGAQARAIFPADLLPDLLYIQTPYGGKGSDGTAAVVGGRAWVSVQPNLGIPFTVLRSGDADAAIGGDGSTGGGSAGSGGSILTGANCSYCHFSFGMEFIFGVSGSNGGSGTGPTAGGSQTALSYLPITGGAGGGAVSTANASSAGGDITGNGLLSTVAGGANTGADGNSGLYLPQPFCTTGGSGAGGLNGQGGRGGDAQFGSGGGGGGGGTTGGFGGKGGDSLAIIVTI